MPKWKSLNFCFDGFSWLFLRKRKSHKSTICNWESHQKCASIDKIVFRASPQAKQTLFHLQNCLSSLFIFHHVVKWGQKLSHSFCPWNTSSSIISINWREMLHKSWRGNKMWHLCQVSLLLFVRTTTTIQFPHKGLLWGEVMRKPRNKGSQK